MVAFFDFILDFIRIDLIIGFGWYSILYFIFKLFRYKKEVLARFDKEACKTVVFLGILFMVVWLLAVTLNYFGLMEDDQRDIYIRRMTGPYLFAYFLQPLFLLMLTQLLRIRFVNRFLLFRIIVVIPFILTFERFVIIVTSFHRDYLPSSWSIYTPLGYPWWEFLLSILLKAIVFAIIVLAYIYVKKRLLKLKTANR